MAIALKPEDFQKCKKGTVFAYGPRWALSELLILEDIIIGDGYWGFWANSPMWPDGNGEDEFGKLEDMLERGESVPADQSVSKFMSYDGKEMEAFFVLEKDDWDRICAAVTFP